MWQGLGHPFLGKSPASGDFRGSEGRKAGHKPPQAPGPGGVVSTSPVVTGCPPPGPRSRPPEHPSMFQLEDVVQYQELAFPVPHSTSITSLGTS